MGASTVASASELLPSVGSVGHFEGQCSRCCFFPKGRCNKGKDCTFCHFDHDRRPRRCKRGGAKNNKNQEEDATSSSGSELMCVSQVAVEAESLEQPSVEPGEPVAAAPMLMKPPGLLSPIASCKPLMLPPPLPALQATGPMQGAGACCMPVSTG